MGSVGVWFFFGSGVIAWLAVFSLIGFYACIGYKSRQKRPLNRGTDAPSDFCAVEGAWVAHKDNDRSNGGFAPWVANA